MSFIKSGMNIIVLIVVVLSTGAIIYSTSKAGFGLSTKTFMDWVELLIIPASLAFFVYFSSKSEKEREDRKVTDQQQEDALQKYLDKVTEILRERETLRQEDLNAIKIRTLTVLRRLDAKRKADVVKFLFESKLICNKMIVPLGGERTEETSQISLKDADLKGVDLHGSFFQLRDYKDDSQIVWKINLAEADLSNANFEGATLIGADLHGAKFINANLKGFDGMWANCKDAIFENATLIRATLSSAELVGTNFRKANCRYCSFDASTFIVVKSADKVIGVDFTDSNLSNASFSHATIFPDHLKKGKLWNTRLPSGRLYAHLHPLFSVNLKANLQNPIIENVIDSGTCKCKKNITVDKKKVIEDKSFTRDGKKYEPDYNNSILEALWKKYHSHAIRTISKNPIKMMLQILWEFDANHVMGANRFGQTIYRIESGLRFWRAYKKNYDEAVNYNDPNLYS